MKILIVASYNAKRFSPFVMEQVAELEKYGCRVEWFGIARKGIQGYLQELPRLCKKIYECQPDVIHAHYGLSCLFANLATRNIPVVSTYHGSDINERHVLLFSKIAMRLSAWNIFVSQKTLDIAKPKQRYELLPCGVNLTGDQLCLRVEARHKIGWSQEEKIVLFAGAFDNPVKMPELAHEVIMRVKGAHLIELKGFNRREVNMMMCAANCLLMTSKTEGSPQVIKEAMACGCPIVSVDVGDVYERLSGLEGCYVAQTREPQEIAALLEKALAFDGKTAGRERIIKSGLDNKQVAHRIIEIYESVMENL